MFKTLYEALMQSLIRFFNNRFIKGDESFYYRTEIDKLRQRNEFLENRLFEILSPRKVTEVVSPEGELEPVMQPVESFFAKRQRLEKESQANWIKQLEEAQARINSERAKKKSTEELEKEMGLTNGSSNN